MIVADFDFCGLFRDLLQSVVHDDKKTGSNLKKNFWPRRFSFLSTIHLTHIQRGWRHPKELKVGIIDEIF